MHLLADGSKIPAARAINDQRLVAAAEEVAKELVPPLEASSIGAEKPFHPSHQRRLRRLDQQMKMVGHQTIRMHLPSTPDTRFPQRLHKALPVAIILEDRFASITTIHHVIDRSGILDSQFARHDRENKALSKLVNHKN